MFNNFEIDICNIFKDAEEEKNNLHHPFVGSEHLLLAILKNDKEIRDICKINNVTYKNFREELIKIVGIPKLKNDINLYTPLLKRIINNSLNDAKENNCGKVTSNHLMLAIFDEGEGVAIRIMLGMDVDIDKLYNDLKIDNKENIKISCGKILNDIVKKDEKLIGRDREINYIIETLLRKNKNNPLLIGDAGVGKTAIIEELARRINKKNVPEALENCKILVLEMGSLVAGTKYRGEFEEKLTNIINNLEENENYILFIDEIHTMVNAGGAEGAITAGDILKPYLAREKIKCIGATTTGEYNKFIKGDKALARRFEIIQIREPNENETINILKKVKDEYEKYHNITITNDIIKEIVTSSNKYINNRKNPDKSLDLLDSLCSFVKRKNDKSKDINALRYKIKLLEEKKIEKIQELNYEEALKYKEKEINLENEIKKVKDSKCCRLTKNDLLKVLENKCNIPFLINKEKIIKTIKENLEKNLIEQNTAKNKIIYNFQNAFNTNNSLSLLLEGATGVGKSETIKIIQKSFKNMLNFIKLDMKEFTYESSIYKLIGYPNSNEDFIFNKIRENPYTMIFIKDISFACEEVMNLIIKIIEDKKITDSKNEEIDFKNTFIMATNKIDYNTVGFAVSRKNENESFNFRSKFDDIIKFDNITINIVEKYFEKNKIDKEKIGLINYQKNGLKNINKLITKVSA